MGVVFPVLSTGHKRKIIHRWSAQLLRIFQVRLTVTGVPPNDETVPRMMVANHVSWLDIFAINSVYPVRFIAKSEIRDWPIIGRLCAQAGTLFMVRAKARQLKRVNKTITHALMAGDCIAVFPEGTTTYGDRIESFHASLLQPAIATQAVLCPVALRFLRHTGELNSEAAYVGDTSFMESLWAIVGQRVIYAELVFLEPIKTDGKSRQILARELEQIIAAALDVSVPNKTLGRSSDLQRAPQSDDFPRDNRYPTPANFSPPADQALTSARK